MNATFKNCDQEQIHLCGKIQDFGYLLVFDSSQHCIAYSANIPELLPIATPMPLGVGIEEILAKLRFEETFDFSEVQIKVREGQRLVFNTAVSGRKIYLSIYLHQDKYYLEFESKKEYNQSYVYLQNFSRHLDQNKNNIWGALCDNISSIIQYDRVMVYQFLEDNSGIVVAEKVIDGLDSLRGYRFPEFDIPAQARALYKKMPSRMVADINSTAWDVIGLEANELDLGYTGIRALSPMHLHYLRNAGVAASVSFSILINGNLWGLIACQNRAPKHIDLGQRHLCYFITQHAANHYLTLKTEDDLKFNELKKTIELEIKEKLLVQKNILKVFQEIGPKLIATVAADGMIIRHPHHSIAIGITPGLERIEHIHKDIVEHTQETFYITKDYREPYTLAEGEVRFPGIVKMDIDQDHTFSVYWFRKEQVVEEIWAGNPEKNYAYDAKKKIILISPRTSFHAWRQLVKGKSSNWLDKEILFIRRIKQLIQGSIATKIAEIQRLNEQLMEINNSLDTYTHTLAHDLKNPLSSIKLGAQMILQRKDLSPELLEKIALNMLDAVELMNNMMNMIYDFSKAKSFAIKIEKVQTEHFIHQLISDGKKRYNVPHLHVHIGDLLDVKGEQTLLYQMFMNLINNAIKFSSKKEKPAIKVSSYATDKHIIYKIRDNGIGIPNEELANIYEIFKRTRNAHVYEGTGVGLSIVKRIIDRLEGDIQVESIIGEGTAFKVCFKH